MNGAETIPHTPVLLPSGRTRTPTGRQEQAVRAYVDGNGRKTKAEVLRSVGYSESVVDHPDKVFKSATVMQIAEEMGLNEKPALSAVKRNLTYKDRRVQLLAADMLFKLLGSYAPKKFDTQIGVFSLADLREKMRKGGFEVTDQPS